MGFNFIPGSNFICICFWVLAVWWIPIFWKSKNYTKPRETSSNVLCHIWLFRYKKTKIIIDRTTFSLSSLDLNEVQENPAKGK